jgi:alkaline phosphatase D
LHLGGEIKSLEEYRIRYSQYRLDPLLANMHAQCPWAVVPDDHEVDNDYANTISEEPDIDPIDFLVRRANAYQAYYEMMPVRRTSMPQGADIKLYRRVDFGRLAQFLMLDGRQYRSDQPHAGKRAALSPEALDSKQTMLGQVQKNWMYNQLIGSQAQWNILAQQVMMGMVNRVPLNKQPEYSMDQWPGYTAERDEVVGFLQERRIRNPIVLTGDIHSNWVNHLRADDLKPEQPVVAVELVGTSLSSGGNGKEIPDDLDKLYSANPGLKYHNQERGYVRCQLSPTKLQADFMTVSDVLKPGGVTNRRVTFVVESDTAQAEQI